MNTNSTLQMNAPRFLSVLMTLAICLFIVPNASADDSAAAKSRMSARQGQVDGLKSSGLVGEANTGYLAARGALSGAQQAVVSAENADRKVLYGVVAAKTGSNVATVGKRRADQIRGISAKGVWLQLPDGSWKKK